MSYNVYITRGQFWADDDATEISADEWSQLVAADPELRHDTANGPYFAVLAGSGDDGPGWLDWSAGNVYATYPDRQLQRKLLQVSARLGARVQGEDGEVYATIDDFPVGGRPGVDPAEADVGLPAYARRERLWRIAVYTAIAAAIVAANVFDFW